MDSKALLASNEKIARPMGKDTTKARVLRSLQRFSTVEWLVSLVRYAARETRVDGGRWQTANASNRLIPDPRVSRLDLGAQAAGGWQRKQPWRSPSECWAGVEGRLLCPGTQDRHQGAIAGCDCETTGRGRILPGPTAPELSKSSKAHGEGTGERLYIVSANNLRGYQSSK
ncbi:hypothetical protein NDU88_005609 [Pleurodeles waltl]|uniref:Uncharacterized protein n=1 Tax=Pleurodeles waltl TaxID=8319 RepID=A0AAV7MAH0_PLEWA|nr:hypothetical protein NDU88_005609 [Pleurodeles waltl]